MQHRVWERLGASGGGREEEESSHLIILEGQVQLAVAGHIYCCQQPRTLPRCNALADALLHTSYDTFAHSI